MTTTQVSKATLKRLHEMKDATDFNSMEDFLDGILLFLEDHLGEFNEEIVPEDETGGDTEE